MRHFRPDPVDPAELAKLMAIPPDGKPIALLCLGHIEAFYPRPMLESAGCEERRALTDLVFENHWQRPLQKSAEQAKSQV